MACKFSCLKDKLEDEEYLESLCYRSKNEIKVVEEYLSNDELNHYSSITVAYKLAKKRYMEENFDPEFLEERIHKKGIIAVRYKDAITP